MDNNLLFKVAAITYSKMSGLNRDAMKVCASALIRNPENFANYENNDRLKYVQSMKFPTKAEENKFKEAIALTSALIRGTEELFEVDEYYTPQQVKAMTKKDSSYFNDMKPTGKVGRYHMYSFKPAGKR